MRLGSFVRFSLIGVVGFAVDASVLLMCVRLLQLGPYEGRLVSYVFAASTTWFLNRNFAFSDARRDRPHLQWFKFLAVNAVGGAVNYGTYAVLIAMTDIVAAHPVLGVAAGSIAGLFFNFCGSRLLVFRPSVTASNGQKA